MSEATLTVPTAFVDIAQHAGGLRGRVEPDKLMLYGPSPYDDGAEVHFAVTLNDGSAAFAGVGRAIQSVDGGEERPEVARFDIILDSLEFAGSGQIVYERVLMVAYGEGTDTGEVDLQEVDAEEADVTEFADSLPPEAMSVEPIESDYPEDSTIVASADAYATVVDATADRPASTNPPPAGFENDYADDAGTVAVSEDPFDVAVETYSEPPAVQVMPSSPLAGATSGEDTHIVDFADVEESPENFLESMPPDSGYEAIPIGAGPPPLDAGMAGMAGMAGSDGTQLEPGTGPLLRGSVRASWHPQPIPSPESSGAEGAYFNFGATLPIPQNVPRPELDPSLRIQPAPRPAGGEHPDGGSSEPEAAHAGGANGGYAAPSDDDASAPDPTALSFDDLPETAQADPALDLLDESGTDDGSLDILEDADDL